jgi:hypothetical protein
VVGDAVLPRHLFVSRHWHLKKPDRADADAAREVEAYLTQNPHEERLREIFRRAGIDYGRIDYSLAGDAIQVWEINTNPTVLRLAERLTEALERLGVASSAGHAPIRIHLEARLLAAGAREVRRDRRALRARELLAGILASRLTRPLRLAVHLLRGA